MFKRCQEESGGSKLVASGQWRVRDVCKGLESQGVGFLVVSMGWEGSVGVSRGQSILGLWELGCAGRGLKGLKVTVVCGDLGGIWREQKGSEGVMGIGDRCGL